MNDRLLNWKSGERLRTIAGHEYEARHDIYATDCISADDFSPVGDAPAFQLSMYSNDPQLFSASRLQRFFDFRGVAR